MREAKLRAESGWTCTAWNVATFQAVQVQPLSARSFASRMRRYGL